MGSYILRRTGKYSKNITLWSKTPDHAFSYNKKDGTFWNVNLDEYVIRNSYLVLLLKWKLAKEKLDSPFVYEIVKESEALVAGVIDE